MRNLNSWLDNFFCPCLNLTSLIYKSSSHVQKKQNDFKSHFEKVSYPKELLWQKFNDFVSLSGVKNTVQVFKNILLLCVPDISANLETALLMYLSKMFVVKWVLPLSKTGQFSAFITIWKNPWLLIPCSIQKQINPEKTMGYQRKGNVQIFHLISSNIASCVTTCLVTGLV